MKIVTTNGSIYINFIGFDKAFESIDRRVMCNLSGQFRIDDKQIRLL